jgi:hypothetical protein
MLWWDIICAKLNVGDILLTPGKGMSGSRQKPFEIVLKGIDKINILSGKFKIPLERACFDSLEEAFHTNPHLLLRVASKHANEPFKDSADALIRNKTGSNLARGNYVCSILHNCGVVRYMMQGNQKCIALPL